MKARGWSKDRYEARHHKQSSRERKHMHTSRRAPQIPRHYHQPQYHSYHQPKQHNKKRVQISEDSYDSSSRERRQTSSKDRSKDAGHYEFKTGEYLDNYRYKVSLPI